MRRKRTNSMATLFLKMWSNEKYLANGMRRSYAAQTTLPRPSGEWVIDYLCHFRLYLTK